MGDTAGRTLDALRFRRAYARVDVARRERFVDRVLGLSTWPDDGDDLPRGCVPYLPSALVVLEEALRRARVGPRDVFVDVGSGVGRALAVAHLLTGAGAIGLEVQGALADRALAMAARVGLPRVRTVRGDATSTIGFMTTGTVFYFFCPFGGARLARTIDALEPLARARPLALCFVDVVVPERAWLRVERAASGEEGALVVCRSTLHPPFAERNDQKPGITDQRKLGQPATPSVE